MSSTPTTSVSVELLLFNFFFVETEIGNPLPNVSPHLYACACLDAPQIRH